MVSLSAIPLISQTSIRTATGSKHSVRNLLRRAAAANRYARSHFADRCFVTPPGNGDHNGVGRPATRIASVVQTLQVRNML